jgi:YaiO family outer membrane protein
MSTTSNLPGGEAHARGRGPRGLFLVLAVGAVATLAVLTGPDALAQPPADPTARIRSLVAAGQLDQASAVVDEWTARDPANLDARAWHARLLAWTNRWSEAESTYRELLGLLPNDVDLLAGLADVLYWQRRGEEALALIDRASALDPQRADIGLRRAQVLEQLGRPREARAAYEDTLAREPTSAEATKGIARLRMPGRYVVRIGSDVDHVDETGNGGVLLASFGVRRNERWSGLASLAQYQRFGESATRVAAEATRRFRGSDWLSVGGAIASDQDIVPRQELQIEYGHVFRLESRGPVRGVEAAWQQRCMWYRDASVVILSPGAVFYLPKDWLWLVRVSANWVSISGAESEWRASGWTRLTIPLHPTIDGFVQFAIGAEDYGYRDQIIGFTARTGGAGLRWRFAPGQEISGYGQYQSRSNGQAQTSVGASYAIRF